MGMRSNQYGPGVVKRGNQFAAVLQIPKDVRKAFGKTTFVASLKTDSPAVARRRAAPLIASWKAEIAAARGKAAQTDLDWFKDALANGHRLFVADLHADQLLALANAPGAEEALIFNVRAPDDALRDVDCRANLFHVMPSRAMKADALAQYLVSKKWRDWLLRD